VQRGGAVQLHYFARSAEHAAFLAPLSQPALAPHCHFHFGLSAHEAGAAIFTQLSALPRTTPLYICGPAPFIAAVCKQAAQCGWRDADVHFELFAAETPVVDSDSAQDRVFELVLQGSGVRCTVQPGQSIVEAAAAAGVQIGTSCGEGFCGSCRTVVLAGIPDHRDSVLSEKEHAANQCLMPCVSRCRGERLVLDL
jgi:vanillate O-demethylase ferredoxin subunit